MSSYLNGLNEQQIAAVQQTKGPVMIIAGAGSGKTRVITMRVAHLIEIGVDPFQILVLTFTNKAAKEMKERIVKQVGAAAKNVWMGTFHSVFAKILRFEADKIGYPANFTIYDTEDSKTLIKTILKELDLDDKAYNPNYVYGRISSAKNNLISVEEYKRNPTIQAEDTRTRHDKMSDIYQTYTNRCFRAGAMDFDDLLYKTNILLKDHPDVLYKYQNKFKYLMVDEYQDTNYSQYLIIKRLAAINENICVVGDDAQSIYAFRGANIQNILNFQKDYPDAQVFKLEQNYRSTQNIVQVANSIIANNQDQLKKNIFSEQEEGEKIKICRAISDNEEGKLVAEAIAQEHSLKGWQHKDFAILYRTNAQSRALEESLRKINIPYKIYGGMSFYQRKEIKDLLAYFRVIINPNDDEALKRIINYPTRGIGKTTLEQLIIWADQHQTTLWNIAENIVNIAGNVRGVSHVVAFVTMMKSFATIIKQKNAYDAALHIAQHAGILKELYEDKSVEGLSRYENIQELLNGIKEFSEREDIEEKSLAVFMQDVALLTNDDKDKDKNENTVSLMTIHAAKGLEFKHVFVVGLEENLFPSQMSLNSKADLEEERRLFYVAVTRAETVLTLSYATSRYKWGTLNYCEPSRFLDEIAPQYLHLEHQKKSIQQQPNNQTDTFNKPKPKTTLPTAHIPSPNFKPSEAQQIQTGMNVEHERFGYGKILTLEGKHPDIKATVFFQDIGQKQLLLKFAKLRIVID